MSLGGALDAPEIVQEAKPYFLSSEEHNAYQKKRLFAAGTLQPPAIAITTTSAPDTLWT
jgi:hypothetical protein